MGQFEVLKKIQEIELDALKEFNKICKENNLMFFLRGGSVMGAVKYKGLSLGMMMWILPFPEKIMISYHKFLKIK